MGGIQAVNDPNDPYKYDPQRTTEFDPTAMGDMFQTPYNPPAAPVVRNPLVDAPTIKSPVRGRQRVVAPPTTVRGKGESAARMSLILGIISFILGLLPVCGIAALLPAAVGIVYGWLGLKSRQRNKAILGMLLCMLAIAAALAVVA